MVTSGDDTEPVVTDRAVCTQLSSLCVYDDEDDDDNDDQVLSEAVY